MTTEKAKSVLEKLKKGNFERGIVIVNNNSFNLNVMPDITSLRISDNWLELIDIRTNLTLTTVDISTISIIWGYMDGELIC